MQTLANDHIPRAWFEKLEVPFAVMLPKLTTVEETMEYRPVDYETHICIY